MTGLPALFAIFASSFLIAMSGAMMPGPLLTATVSESSDRGFMAGPLIIVGHGILELLLVAALLMGLASILQKPEAFIITAIAGSAILVWMAWGMFSSIPTLSLSAGAGPTRRNHPVISGILMSLANPYWTIWWATIGVGYILYSLRFGLAGVAFFFSGHILADLAWYSFISAVVAGGRRFLTDRVYRAIIAALAVFLVLFACWFACAGIVRLVQFIA